MEEGKGKEPVEHGHGVENGNVLMDFDELYRRMYYVKQARSTKIVESYNEEQDEIGVYSSGSYWRRKVPHMMEVSMVVLFFCIVFFSIMVKVGMSYLFSGSLCLAILAIAEFPFVCMLLYTKRNAMRYVLLRIVGIMTVFLWCCVDRLQMWTYDMHCSCNICRRKSKSGEDGGWVYVLEEEGSLEKSKFSLCDDDTKTPSSHDDDVIEIPMVDMSDKDK